MEHNERDGNNDHCSVLSYSQASGAAFTPARRGLRSMISSRTWPTTFPSLAEREAAPTEPSRACRAGAIALSVRTPSPPAPEEEGKGEGDGERESQRVRDKERHVERDRERDRERQKETKRQRTRETERQTERQRAYPSELSHVRERVAWIHLRRCT